MKPKVLLVIAALLSNPFLPGQSVRSDLKSGKKQIRTLVLMPVQVNLNRVTLKGHEPMVEESRDSEVPLALEIGAALRDLGYELDQASLSHQALAKDDYVRYTVDDMQKRFDEELRQLQRKSSDVRKGRFTLGDQVAKLPLPDNLDALLFVRANAHVLTDNKKAFGYFVAGSVSDTAHLDIALVDAKTGDVLYYARKKVEGDLIHDSESVASTIEKAFSNLPRARPASREDRHKAQGANAQAAVVESAKQVETAAASAPETIAPGPDSHPQRIRVSHAVLKGMLVRSVRPEYPGIASANFVHGDVVLRIVIDTLGRVAEVKVVSGPPQLLPAATSAMKQWRYHPVTLNGQAFEVETEITFTFDLQP